MVADLSQDIAAVQAIVGIDALLARVCALTGMRFAAVARVDEARWTACLVLDQIEFGLEAGSELELCTTICNEIRLSRTGVFIDHVAMSPMWRVHPTPVLYGFQSYLSRPIILADGSFFGTLCAIDPEPRGTSLADIIPAIDALAATIARDLDASRLLQALAPA